MTEKIFFDSDYRFIDPIRYFKANDPYYYEVDNIPIKQLEENVKFIKDQIQGVLGSVNSTLESFEIDRSKFSELRPYIDGTNNIVKVKPGRFSARINDAYNLNILQLLEQISGFNFPETNVWRSKQLLDDTLRAIIEKFQDTVFFAGMNGLSERTFQFPLETIDLPTSEVMSSDRELEGIHAWPNYKGIGWWKSSTRTFRTNQQVIDQTLFPNSGLFNDVSWNEADFIKRWRGVTRTAIVDVQNELEIEIPPFNAEDFWYVDENGVKQLVDSNHRIDLVFIYSKPIDASGTTINKFVNGSPVTLTEPALGIVKGAGVGISFRRDTVAGIPVVALNDSDGIPQIMAHSGDETGTNIGFGDIKGSFPSPDDLMNLAPLLSESLETDNYALIGQSILPVAYVVIRNTAGTNNNGVNVIAIDDLIDIRPFFRTTELSYNERAGIAAAMPQIGLNNPIASEGYVDSLIKKAYNDYTAKLTQTQAAIENNSKLVGAGYVRGGYNFGVEGTLGKMIELKYGITDKSQQKQEIINRFGYPQNIAIPDFPDWDIAKWCQVGNFSSKGSYPNDYINFHTQARKRQQLQNSSAPLRCGSFKEFELATRIAGLGTDVTITNVAPNAIYFVKKTIQIDRSQISWASDYTVDVQLQHCVPASCRSTTYSQSAGTAAIWVDKRPNEFTIYVSWVAKDHIHATTETDPSNLESGTLTNRYPSQDRNNGEHFAGFSVINEEFVNWDYPGSLITGEIEAGVALYPTVAFKIFGIPNTLPSINTDLNINNPLIILR